MIVFLVVFVQLIIIVFGVGNGNNNDGNNNGGNNDNNGGNNNNDNGNNNGGGSIFLVNFIEFVFVFCVGGIFQFIVVVQFYQWDEGVIWVFFDVIIRVLNNKCFFIDLIVGDF